ncbi:hypothetical protein M3204_09655 [Mesobacillus subterraneus]|uniref:hypothetical protein n=1 Tax=Mesobacillus subterraneus TaxID=285983 RepID=UPI002041F414|nr:hypothetical protein [Mesobacillus subterraneus]MCM3664669.1 hypothetical protein [Mesobacillus subterraneus]MCM3683817.1 hypothetical protein [Mesobacillus subterraneus]
MGIVLFSVLLFVLGIFCMWMAIFSSKKDFKEFGPGLPTDLIEFFLLIIYKLFPSLVRRIFLFLLGLGIEAVAIFILFI